PHMTVRDNVAFGLKMDRVNRVETARRVDEALALVGLEEFGSRSPAQLSGGQQQRVAVARALVKRPAVLLLDEPLGALDLKLRQRLQVELSEIHREVGTTFVYVTHDQEEAMSMADRIAVMNQGQIEQLGTPFDIYRHPSSRFVADFIGDANFLDVRVDGEVALLSDGTHVPCEVGSFQQGVLMVRPGSLRVGDLNAAPGGAGRGRGGEGPCGGVVVPRDEATRRGRDPVLRGAVDRRPARRGSVVGSGRRRRGRRLVGARGCDPPPGGRALTETTVDRPVTRRARRLGPALSAYGGFLPAVLLLGCFFLVPLGIIVVYSFWQVIDYNVVHHWTLDNYRYFFSVGSYVRTMWVTLWVSLVATALALGLAFPFAYWLSRYVPRRLRAPLLVLVVVPFWTSYLLRVYSWLTILGGT